MTTADFYHAVRSASTVSDLENAVRQFQREEAIRWLAVGRENNRGTIEVSSDPARSAVERLTNGIDGILELEHHRHAGIPECRSPKEAAVAWLNVPEGGISAMSRQERRTLAQKVTIRMEEGEGRESRILEVRDRGIGIAAENIARTILSLNESNKLQKHYLAGAYGQGGSSTFAFSRYTLIVCRAADQLAAFTVVKFLDLPAERYKTGHYVYLALQSGVIPTCDASADDFPQGVLVRHFGYDLGRYPSPLGPSSLYGSLNCILFDPIMPVWLDDRVHGYRRVIKGSRNALNGAVDEGDERTGPPLSHNLPMFNVSLGDFGRIGIEYWVLEQPTKENKRPSAAFVNPAKPIVLTLNGQNQGEMSHVLIRRDAELPFLSQRLICHIDCNYLSATSKRLLFVSNREGQRNVKVRDLIQQELLKALKSDDILRKLNDEARRQGAQEQDEDAIQQMRNEVARLLRIHGVEMGQAGGGSSANGQQNVRPVRPPKPRPIPEPIELHEPPTFIRFVWDEEDEITFYPEQRRYLRMVTDANSTYHNPSSPGTSKINLVVGDQLIARGSTPLQGGRMRVIVEASSSAQPGHTGLLRVELARPGLPVLVDERPYEIVKAPDSRPADRRASLPAFKTVPVGGPDDPKWPQLGWPDNAAMIASQAEMEDGVLVIYYSTVFPKFENQRHTLENKDPVLATSFTRRYEIWLAVHSLLHYQDQQLAAVDSSSALAAEGDDRESSEDAAEERERQERCRVAILSALFAARESQLETPDSIAIAE
ncbi:MAG: hypothetical protein ACRD40_02375 [Candidatus Acidiferrales bacterium]